MLVMKDYYFCPLLDYIFGNNLQFVCLSDIFFPNGAA